MRIAITGSGGFLGAALVTAVEAKGWTPVRISLPRDIKIEDPGLPDEIVKGAAADAFIHCAVALRPRSRQELFLNEHMPARFARAFIKHGRRHRFIYLSSFNVVIPELNDRYSNTKRTAETELKDLGVTILRPGLIWDWNGTGVAEMIMKILDGPVPLRAMLAPGHTYRPIDAPALTRFILEGLEKDNKAQAPINILGDQEYSLWALAAGLAEKRKRHLFRLPTKLAAKLTPPFIRKVLLSHELLQQLIPIDRSGQNISSAGAESVILRFAHWSENR